MKCPKCSSNQTYRRHPHSLEVRCDRCGHSFQAGQAQGPILEAKVYCPRGAMRGTHRVTVWYCPTDSIRYSFALSFGGGIRAFHEFPDDPDLSGCYSTPEEALQAGEKKVNE